MAEKSTARFALIADAHLFHPENTAEDIQVYRQEFAAGFERLQRGLREIETHDLEFVLFLGDMIDFYTPEDVAYFHEATGSCTTPIHLCFGNHDLIGLDGPGEWSVDIWEEARAGWLQNLEISETYHSFAAANTHFIVLDTSREPRGGVDDQQLEWLKQELEENQDRPVILFSHKPLPVPGLILPVFENWGLDLPQYFVCDNYQRLLRLLEEYDNIEAFYSGHIHFSFCADLHGVRHETLPWLSSETPVAIRGG